MLELDSGWVRRNIVSWRELQPVEGGAIQWDLLEELENDLRLIRAAGMKPIIVVDDYPRYATTSPSSCTPIRPDKYAAFGEFMHALVARYSTDEYNVMDWELGNEIDVDHRLVAIDSHYGCWGDIDDLYYYGGDDYGEMLKAVSPYIKAADPSARIWIGGLMVISPNTTDPNLGKPENFLRGILASGAAPYFDVVAYHAHTGYWGSIIDSEMEQSGPWIPLGGGIRGKARFLRQIMDEYGVDKPLVINEIGVFCREDKDYCSPEPDPEFFPYQADMLVRIATRVVSEGVSGLVWYTLNGPGWRNVGLLQQYTTERRPSYYAYQELIRQLKGTEYSNPVLYGDEIEAYAFKKQYGNLVHIVWAKQNVELPVSIPQSKFIEARSRDGLLITPLVDGSNYQVPVSFSPIYILLSP